MRKIFLIISTLIIFFSSVVLPMKKAEAVVQVGVPLAAASGAGYAAVGAYVVGALLVAGGVAVIADDPDAAEKIREHGYRIWNGFDQVTRDAWTATIDASVAAGKGTLEISDNMLSSLNDAIDLMGNSAQVIVNEKELTGAGLYPVGSSSATSFGLTAPSGALIAYKGTTGPNVGISESIYDKWNYYKLAYNGNFEEVPYTNFTRDDIMYTGVNSYGSFITKWLSLGIAGGLPVVMKADSIAPTADYYTQSLTQAVDTLGGVKEVTLDMEKWIPRSTTGDQLVTDTTGAITLQDGTPYTGNITWEHPKIGVPSIPTVDAPSVPIDNVTVGDTTFIPKETATPTTGDVPTILTGLWDWLKGILQAILDAIKAVASGVVSGLTLLLEAIKAAINQIGANVQYILDTIIGLSTAIAEAIGAIFLPSEGYFTNYFKDINSAWALKIPFLAQLKEFLDQVRDTTFGSQLPKIEVDLPERYGGQKMSVIDFSYFTQYRDWILNFIRFSAWFVFLKRLYARIPKVVGG